MPTWRQGGIIMRGEVLGNYRVFAANAAAFQYHSSGAEDREDCDKS